MSLELSRAKEAFSAHDKTAANAALDAALAVIDVRPTDKGLVQFIEALKLCLRYARSAAWPE